MKKADMARYEASVLNVAKSAWLDRQGDTNMASPEETAAAKRLAKRGLVELTKVEKWGTTSVQYVRLTPAGAVHVGA